MMWWSKAVKDLSLHNVMQSVTHVGSDFVCFVFFLSAFLMCVNVRSLTGNIIIELLS